MNYIPVIIAAASTAKTPLSITANAKDGIAFITISGYISQWSKASSTDIAAAIAAIKGEGITEAAVYINTEGGSVFEAIEINNLLEDNFDTIAVRVGALAASAGTYFVAKYHTTAKKNSQFMIHKPMAGASGNEDEVESTLKLLKNVTNDYRKLYATKMGITEKAVNKLWDKGDHWMTAQEAKDKGLIDAIDGEDEDIDANTQQLLVACGAPVIPEITTNTKTENIMKLELLIALLGMDANSTEAQVKARIEALKVEAAAAAQVVADAKLKEKAEKAGKIKALLDDAEKSKKLTPELRATYKTLLEANLEAGTSALEALTGIDAAPSASVTPTTVEVTGEKKSWNYEQWRKEDPTGFEALPEATQKTLIEAHYKED